VPGGFGDADSYDTLFKNNAQSGASDLYSKVEDIWVFAWVHTGQADIISTSWIQ
jgi:hypothetical protein